MTTTTRLLIAVSSIVLLAPIGASAVSIQPRTLELDARFNFQHSSVSIDAPTGDEDFGDTIFDLDTGVGYFINSRVEILGALVVHHESIDNFDITSFGLKASGYYHFNASGNMIPYVGLGLGMITHGGDSVVLDQTEAIFPELSIGLRIPFEDIVSMNVAAGYRHRFSAFGIEDASANDFFMGFGISFFLKGGVGE
jgi:hypothetical protein